MTVANDVIFRPGLRPKEITDEITGAAFRACAATAIGAILMTAAIAQTPPEYGAPISLAAAKKVMAAAEGEASKGNWPMVIAIVDSGGHLVMLHRVDHAQHGSILIAQQKAETAVNFKRPTKLFEEAIQAGGLNLRILGTRNLTPLDGGLPLVVDRKVVGAIGVSGLQPTQDAQVAKAGADAL